MTKLITPKWLEENRDKVTSLINFSVVFHQSFDPDYYRYLKEKWTSSVLYKIWDVKAHKLIHKARVYPDKIEVEGCSEEICCFCVVLLIRLGWIKNKKMKVIVPITKWVKYDKWFMFRIERVDGWLYIKMRDKYKTMRMPLKLQGSIIEDADFFEFMRKFVFFYESLTRRGQVAKHSNLRQFKALEPYLKKKNLKDDIEFELEEIEKFPWEKENLKSKDTPAQL